MSDTVLVTGASGFIAQHIVKALVEKGYNVVGTVRLAAKGDKIQKNCLSSSGSFAYSVVPDISAANAFGSMFKEHPQITVVLHTASPFFYDTTDPDQDLIVPAIEGTTNIMSAIEDAVSNGVANIKRVVITSSDAALYSPDDEQNAALSFDETSWNQITREEAVKDAINAYYGAKTFAEKIAWQYAAKPKFPPLSAVNPVYVFGPQAFENEMSDKLNTSNEVINSLFNLKATDAFDNDMGGWVDVRDVARAHLAAFEQPETVGKRLYMTNGKFCVQMMLDSIHKNFPELVKNLPVGKPGTGAEAVKVLAKTDNSATRKILGFDFVSLDTCLKDVVEQIVRYRDSKL